MYTLRSTCFLFSVMDFQLSVCSSLLTNCLGGAYLLRQIWKYLYVSGRYFSHMQTEQPASFSFSTGWMSCKHKIILCKNCWPRLLISTPYLLNMQSMETWAVFNLNISSALLDQTPGLFYPAVHSHGDQPVGRGSPLVSQQMAFKTNIYWTPIWM